MFVQSENQMHKLLTNKTPKKMKKSKKNRIKFHRNHFLTYVKSYCIYGFIKFCHKKCTIPILLQCISEYYDHK